ncbi:lipase family protein [Alkalicoccus luteus]|uniref:lipase family protein n=1 Tax=Alkalicoccus luteus TaxID=1237094 RepID=UPI004033AD13
MYTYLITKLVAAGNRVVTVGSPADAMFSVLSDGTWISQPEAMQHDTEELYQRLLSYRVIQLQAVIKWLNGENEDQSITIVGHSIGGAAAWIAANDVSGGLQTQLMDPSLQLLSARDLTTRKAPCLILHQEQEEEACKLVEPAKKLVDSSLKMEPVKGADHLSFCDLPLLFGNKQAAYVHQQVWKTITEYMQQAN